MNLKTVKIFNKWSIDLRILTLILLAIFSFRNSIYYSFTISLNTGSWRLFLIPFVFFIYKEEGRFKSNTIVTNVDLTVSLLLIFSASMFQYLARWAGINILYELSLVTLIISIIIVICGIKGLFGHKWSLFYLLFMTSATDELLVPIQETLRNISTLAVSFLMPLAGMPILRDGTNIRLTNIIMNVAAECSGVNQLISLFVISVPLAIMLIRSSVLRIIVIFSSIPLSLFSNILRLFIIGSWNYSREEFSHGPHGLFAMSSIFAIGMILLYLLTIFISRFDKRENNDKNDVHEKIRNVYALSLMQTMTILISIFVIPIIFVFITPDKSKDYVEPITLKGEYSEWKEIDNSLSLYSDTLMSKEYRIQKTYMDNDSNQILVEINNYPFQDSEKNIELTSYTILRLLYDSKVKQSKCCNLSYTFGYNSVDGVLKNQKPTSIIYHVNNKITGNRRKIKGEVIKQLLIKRRNSGSIIAFSLIKKGKIGYSDSEILEKFICELFR